MRTNLAKLATAFAGLYCAAMASAAAGRTLWHEETVTLSAAPPRLADLGGGTVGVEIPGLPATADPGRPALPQAGASILVHPGIDFTTLSIELLGVAEETLDGSYRVVAAPPVVRPIQRAGRVQTETIWGAGKQIVGGCDQHVYAVDAGYPGEIVALTGSSQQRTVKSVRLRLSPVQYNPVRGTLRVITAADVRIRYAFDPDVDVPRDNATTEPDFARYVNADALADAYRVVPPGGTAAGRDAYNYVIITTEHIAADSSGLGDYIAHKSAQGFSILVKTVAEIESEYTQALRPELFESTDERADRIRAFLKDKYLEYGIEYVLLIGDPDPDDRLEPHDTVGDVPMKFCYPDWDINPYYAPTDSYYTDLTGRWDVDGDAKYGEWNDDRGVGGVDLAGIEVVVTRIPYYEADLSALDAIFQKIMDYEAPGADESWKRSCFMPNPIDWSDAYGREGNTSPIYMAEWIKNNVLAPEDFDYYRIYEHNFDYPPHNVDPVPEQIPEGLGYTCFTRFDAFHYFLAGVNVASGDIADYTVTTLTDGDISSAWSASDLAPGEFIQLKTADPGDFGATYAPYRLVVQSDAAENFPAQFRIEMAYQANFSDAFVVAEETDAASHAERNGVLWRLEYAAPDSLNIVGGKQFLRLTYTGASPQSFVQLNEFSGYTEEAGSIQPYVIPEWQNGYGVAYFNTHGWPQGASEVITSGECALLDDTRPAFVLSKACSTASPEQSDNLCAQLVKEGGIASIGATRVSYGWGDQGYQLIMPKVVNDNKNFGTVICETRADMEDADWFGWAGMYFDAMRFNLYGDPTVRLLTDRDQDGLPYWEEEAAGLDPDDADTDGDGVPDGIDNCPLVANPDQDDTDDDGIGDACDSADCPGDLDFDDDVDLSDLAALLPNYGTTSGAVYTDGDLDGDGDVDLSDLGALLSVYRTICE